jgi:hypothetical protein
MVDTETSGLVSAHGRVGLMAIGTSFHCIFDAVKIAYASRVMSVDELSKITSYLSDEKEGSYHFHPKDHLPNLMNSQFSQSITQVIIYTSPRGLSMSFRALVLCEHSPLQLSHTHPSSHATSSQHPHSLETRRSAQPACS